MAEKRMKSYIYIQQNNEYDYIKNLIDSFEEGVLGILLIGPPGTAKSTLARTLAQNLGSKLFLIDGSPETDRRDLEGTWVIKKNNTEFVYAALVEAMDEANESGISILLVDEINAFRHATQVAFNPVLAEGELHMISKAGETHKIEPGNKMVFIATMNPGVMGVVSLQEAFDDRFDHNITIEYANKSTEVSIVQKIAEVPKELANIIVSTGREMRDGCIKNDTFDKPFSTRKAVNFAKAIKYLDLKYLDNAIESSIINKIAETPQRRKSTKMFLEGKDFKAQIKGALIRMRTKEEKTETEESMPPAIASAKLNGNATEEMRAVVSNFIAKEGRSAIINTNGHVRWSAIKVFRRDHKEVFRNYFEQMIDLFGDAYISETHMDPLYAGRVSSTFIYWIYQHHKDELTKFMTDTAPVL